MWLLCLTAFRGQSQRSGFQLHFLLALGMTLDKTHHLSQPVSSRVKQV